jgi:hypothetical protein
MACSASSWLDLGNKRVAMENVTHKHNAAVHQEPIRSQRGVLLLSTLALTIGLAVVWYTLLGYGFLALFRWIAG